VVRPSNRLSIFKLARFTRPATHARKAFCYFHYFVERFLYTVEHNDYYKYPLRFAALLFDISYAAGVDSIHAPTDTQRIRREKRLTKKKPPPFASRQFAMRIYCEQFNRRLSYAIPLNFILHYGTLR